ncbi:hypothetical protein E2Y98_08555 [Campylobacter jejuni]|nr:hypothetical protein [Campylobacter jejuni]
MKLVKICNTYILAETIKSFRIFQDENFVVLEIFNGEQYGQCFEIFQSKEVEYHYLFGVKQNSKTIKILNDIDISMQKLCGVVYINRKIDKIKKYSMIIKIGKENDFKRLSKRN